MTGNLLDLDKKGGETFGMGRVYGGVLDVTLIINLILIKKLSGSR